MVVEFTKESWRVTLTWAFEGRGPGLADKRRRRWNPIT